MVGARGFEPPASASRTQRSTRLSHAPTKKGLTNYGETLAYYILLGFQLQNYFFNDIITFLSEPSPSLQVSSSGSSSKVM